MKRCTVVHALAQAQWLWTLELPQDATVADALRAARVAAGQSGDAGKSRSAGQPGIDWDDATVGIHGVVCGRELRFADGDRIEIYRPLTVDPRAARRTRVANARRAGRR
jgi:putative ubiquitin-RnfH superfamily antitoxin RatB of RatAB toxin-antitoxin module